jgi:hypothetical protein
MVGPFDIGGARTILNPGQLVYGAQRLNTTTFEQLK